MTTSLIAAAATLAVAFIVVVLFAARRPRKAAPTPLAHVQGEPGSSDTAFSVAAIIRRTRDEAALAGRAAAEGRPIALRLEDLPSRRWIEERIEERIGELRRDLAVGLADLDQRIRRLAGETADGAPRRAELKARVDQLADLDRGQREKPRHAQDLGVEWRLNQAREELRALDTQLRESQLRHDELVVQRERLPGRTEAEIAYLRETCDTLQLEHDMAYEAAEHRHPDKEPLSPPRSRATPGPVIPLAAITTGARHEGALAGRAASLGTGPSALDGLPSRRWISERFGEHIAAVRAESAADRRVMGEELAVIIEQIRQEKRAIERAERLIAALRDGRKQADAADQSTGHERRLQLAERTHQAAEGRLIERTQLRERLAERQRRSDADYEARIEFLKEALAAAFAEHDLAFNTAARSIVTGQRNGSGPAPFSPTDR